MDDDRYKQQIKQHIKRIQNKVLEIG